MHITKNITHTIVFDETIRKISYYITRETIEKVYYWYHVQEDLNSEHMDLTDYTIETLEDKLNVKFKFKTIKELEDMFQQELKRMNREQKIIRINSEENIL